MYFWPEDAEEREKNRQEALQLIQDSVNIDPPPYPVLGGVSKSIPVPTGFLIARHYYPGGIGDRCKTNSPLQRL